MSYLATYLSYQHTLTIQYTYHVNQRTVTSLLLETPRFLLPQLNIHDVPHTVRPVSTLVFAQTEEDKEKQSVGFPSKGRKQVFYDTLPSVTRAEEINRLTDKNKNNNNDDSNNNNNNDNNNDDSNNRNRNSNNNDSNSNNDDGLTSAQAMAARALLVTPYDPPVNPYLPPLAADPDASEGYQYAHTTIHSCTPTHTHPIHSSTRTPNLTVSRPLRFCSTLLYLILVYPSHCCTCASPLTYMILVLPSLLKTPA